MNTITFTDSGSAANSITAPKQTAKSLYLQALRSFLRTFALLGKATFVGIRHLFTRWPNLTWLAICIALAAYSAVKVGQARSERDRYSVANAQLIQRIDSITNTTTTSR